MKLFNKYSFVAVLGAIMGFVSCTEDFTYEGATVTGQQVFFLNNQPATITLSSSETSFEIPVMRFNTSDAVSVLVNVGISVPAENEIAISCENSMLNFAAGQNEAKLVFTYDPEKIEFDVYHEISLKIADESLTSPYGNSELNFKAGMPQPWTNLGQARFADWFFFDEYEKVTVQQNQLDPDLYRLVDPYFGGLNTDQGEPYMYFRLLHKGDMDPIRGTYEIPEDDMVLFYGDNITGNTRYGISTGYANSSYDGAIIHAVFPGAFGNFEDPTNWVYSRVSGYKEDGTPGQIDFAPYYYMFGHGGWNYIQKAPTPGDGGIQILMPGYDPKDFAIDLFYTGRFTDLAEEDFAVVEVEEMGADVAVAKLFVVEGKNTDAALESILANEEGVQELSQPGSVMFPIPASGTYTAVVVAFDAAGEAQNSASVSFKFQSSKENAPSWHSLGMGLYTDDALISLYQGEPVTYAVEIEESDATPGLYRLVNPYGEGYPYNEEGDWDASKNYYLEINATDPTAVWFEEQGMGVNWGDGEFYLMSYAAMYLDAGYTLDVLKENNITGTLVDGVITFPENKLLCGFGTGDQYYANTNGAFSVVLPSAVPAEMPKAKPAVFSHNRTLSAKTFRSYMRPADKAVLKF